MAVVLCLSLQLLVLLATLDQLAYLVCKANMVRMDLQAQKVPKARLVPLASPDQKVSWDLWVAMVKMQVQAPLVQLEGEALMETLDTLDSMERKDM